MSEELKDIACCEPEEPMDHNEEHEHCCHEEHHHDHEHHHHDDEHEHHHHHHHHDDDECCCGHDHGHDDHDDDDDDEEHEHHHHHHHDHDEDEEHETFFMDNMKYDENIVPLKDTFLMDDSHKKRGFFTETIKQNVVSNQSILQMAMHDKDREIAYYAVSMLTSRMEKLDGELFEKESKVLKGEQQENLPLLQEYASLLKEYMGNKNFIDHVSWRRKQEIYVAILDRLTKLTENNREYFREEVGQLLQLPDYPGAEQVCRDFLERYPRTEEPYLSFIALYVAWKKPEKLQKSLRALKTLPVELSPEALRVIRFWDKGVAKVG